MGLKPNDRAGYREHAGYRVFAPANLPTRFHEDPKQNMRLIGIEHAIRVVRLTLACVMIMVSAHAASVIKPTPQWVAFETVADNSSHRWIEFEVRRFTRPHIDVSADGKSIVFDVLGDIFVVPINGGDATLLVGGPSWDRSPQWSPNGRSISFFSDRVGTNNIWTYDLDTQSFYQVTTFDNPSNYGIYGAPAWSKDGNVLFGTYSPDPFNNFTTRQIYGFSADGRTNLGPLALNWSGISQDRTRTSYMGTPSFTPDGSRAYFDLTHRPTRPGMLYATTNLAVLDMETGAVREIPTPADVNEFSPRVSHSGELLVYGRKAKGQIAEFRVKNLITGRDRRLAELNDIEGFSSGQWEDDAIPSYAFTPDDRNIIISDQGRIVSIRLSNGEKVVIPITVKIRQRVSAPLRGSTRISTGPIRVRAIRWPSYSLPTDSWYFSAVGFLWSMNSDGHISKITHGQGIQTMPAVSPDGSMIAYVSFSIDKDAITNHGTLKIVNLLSGETLYESPDDGYALPKWSPDGRRLAVIRNKAGTDTELAEFGWIDFATKRFHYIADANAPQNRDWRGGSAQHIQFTLDSNHLIFTTGSPVNGIGDSSLFVYKASTKSRKTELIAVARSDVRGVLFSPDLETVVLLGWDGRAYIRDVLADSGYPLTLTTKGALFRPSPATRALYADWVDDKIVALGWLEKLTLYDADASHELEKSEVSLEVPRGRDNGAQIYALTNALVITMSGASGAGNVLENATIIVQNGRIVEVGLQDRVRIPDEIPIVDLDGKTIMPGLVESHMHGILGGGRGSALGYPTVEPPDLSTGIAYGVTTAWDAFESYDDAALERIELIQAGRLIGPRWFHAGGGFSGVIDNGGIWKSVGGVRSHVEKAVELGAPCLKHNNWYVRKWTRQLVDEARTHKLCIVGHVQSMPQMLSLVADGIAPDHFSLPTHTYEDVIDFIAQSQLPWTPHSRAATSIDGGPQNTAVRSFVDKLQSYYPQQWEKLNRFGRDFVDSSETLPTRSYEETAAIGVDRIAAKVAAAGGVIVASADTSNNSGQIMIHSSMWGFVYGGMSNGDALRTATLNAAIKLGLEKQIGSIEVGKLADFLILSKNPLESIENTLSIEYTVIGGQFYNAETAEPMSVSSLAQ